MIRTCVFVYICMLYVSHLYLHTAHSLLCAKHPPGQRPTQARIFQTTPCGWIQFSGKTPKPGRPARPAPSGLCPLAQGHSHSSDVLLPLFPCGESPEAPHTTAQLPGPWLALSQRVLRARARFLLLPVRRSPACLAGCALGPQDSAQGRWSWRPR